MAHRRGKHGVSVPDVRVPDASRDGRRRGRKSVKSAALGAQVDLFDSSMGDPGICSAVSMPPEVESSLFLVEDWVQKQIGPANLIGDDQS